MIKGIILSVIGVIGLAVVYSYRPPTGITEAFMMMGQGKDWFLKEPIYITLMAIFGLLTFFGLLMSAKQILGASTRSTNRP